MARNVQQLVDEQVYRWRLEQQSRAPTAKHVEVANVVTLSNAFGARGRPVGAKVAELLGVPLYDREILHHMATTSRVRVEVVETLDERWQGAIDDFITGMFREKSFYESDYSRALTRTILSLWHHGPSVMLGHGCSHIVPRSHSLAVRITAPEHERVRRVQDLEQLERAEQAKKRLDRVDAEREAFIRKFFGVRVDDPTAYDLVLNTARLDDSACARTIVEAYRHRFAAEATAS